jgi:hypothetical protein
MAVRVKTLQWKQCDSNYWVSDETIFGAYSIRRLAFPECVEYKIYLDDPDGRSAFKKASAELDAKAAAQADYEARIFESIEALPVTELMEALRKAHESLLWCAREGRMASPSLHQYPAKWADEVAAVLAKFGG